LTLSIVLAVALATSTPSPSPAPSPLPEIAHVRTSFLCNTLGNNLFQAVGGLRVNDGLVDQGRMMMAKIAYDAIASPKSVSAGGGAGPASQLDDVQLGILVNGLAQNIDKIETLLADPHRFPIQPTNDEQRELALAKSRLEAVVVQQRASLNILSGIVETNEFLDLQSRCNPADSSCGRAASAGPARISMPEVIVIRQKLTRQAEDNVAPAVLPIVAACR
jgi:hypothetical protein